MSSPAGRIAENLAQVRSRIAEAAARAGRTTDAVKLVAVTKYVSAEIAAAVVAAGCHDLGESRPQELWSKAVALAGLAVRWHLVGHLQRNKIRRTLPLVTLLHSADSLRLLPAVDEEARALERTVDVLLEVNISGDRAKTGLAPDELPAIVDQAAGWGHVSIRGLMGMAALAGGIDIARRDFARLRSLARSVGEVVPPTSYWPSCRWA